MRDRAPSHRWKFFRSGGFDQVRLDTGRDIEMLAALDQKLWVALSCPVAHTAFDPETLAYLDDDGDGRIRAAEVLRAVEWLKSVLRSLDGLVTGSERLALSALSGSPDDGSTAATLKKTAELVLRHSGLAGADSIAAEDVTKAKRSIICSPANGDGVVPPDAAGDEETAAAIRAVIASLGSVTGSDGKPGVDAGLVDRLDAELSAYHEWRASTPTTPFGDSLLAAASAYGKISSKIDDFFLRCDLCAFDPAAAPVLNPRAAAYESFTGADPAADRSAARALPLAVASPGLPLPLSGGVNPAWRPEAEAFSSAVVTPLLGARTSVTRGEWERVKEAVAPAAAWLAGRGGGVVATLGHEGAQRLSSARAPERLRALVAKDLTVADQVKELRSLEKLLLFHRDLHRFLLNFVSFQDFYTLKRPASFQAGTLYVDGRSCDLTMVVDDIDAHSKLAAASGIYLLYCTCTRESSGEATCIAAAVTDGEAGNLLVGRNGVFYDRRGRDWDATVTKIIEHPISIREAFWLPYRRTGRFVNEQLEKFAQNRDKEVAETTTIGARLVTTPGQAAPAAATPFDVGKFAGIFAAVGLAVGALATAIASVFAGFLSLVWWQMPIAVAGMLLFVSGPSMLLAWLKLRSRNLGPLLDAGGWAINTRAVMNIAFGAALTDLAELPPGSERSLADPYAEKKRPWRSWLVLLLLVTAAAAVVWKRDVVTTGWLSGLLARLRPG